MLQTTAKSQNYYIVTADFFEFMKIYVKKFIKKHAKWTNVKINL